MTRPIDREIDCNITRNDRGQDTIPSSEPVRNAPSKAGIEVESHDPTDDRSSNGESVAQKRGRCSEHWRSHHLDEMIHEIVCDDSLRFRNQVRREPEYRRHEYQNLNDVADKGRYITKSRAYHAKQYRHPRPIHGHDDDAGE